MGEFTLASESETQTTLIGYDLSLILKVGDIITLSGDLGAGKSALARAIIQSMAGDQTYEVPSPTYTICNQYDLDPAVAHFDFYRLSDTSELIELGFDEMLEAGCILVEWPELCADKIPKEALNISIIDNGPSAREFTISGEGELFIRAARSFAIRDLLTDSGHENATRTPMNADASARRYEVIEDDGSRLLLMDDPAKPEAVPSTGEKPYNEIAHIAQEVGPFVAIDLALREAGFAAPEILASKIDEGLLLTEHFGTDGVLDGNRTPITERYMASVECLAAMHDVTWPRQVHYGGKQPYSIPDFDFDALLAEASLLTQWYLPVFGKTPLTELQRDAFKNIWSDLHNFLGEGEQSLILRDYHSPNIVWRDKESRNNRVGLIDFQDALIGSSAYDVVSLCQDARVDISQELETQLLEHYVTSRTKASGEFDEEHFKASYAILGAQRNTKILGIFVRLKERDGKPHYMDHLPRIRDYMNRCLQHPKLAPYKDWLSDVVEL